VDKVDSEGLSFKSEKFGSEKDPLSSHDSFATGSKKSKSEKIYSDSDTSVDTGLAAAEEEAE
jgi:hypothetical protein